MSEKILSVTTKELFYVAAMLNVRQLVNVVYTFPADEARFAQELEEVKRSLRKKKLLTESARTGIKLNFALAVCVLFCSNPEGCQVVDTEARHATIYTSFEMYMLLEQGPEDTLTARWFRERVNLDAYLGGKA